MQRSSGAYSTVGIMTRPWRSGADLRRPQRAHCPTAQRRQEVARAFVENKLAGHASFLPHAQKWGVWLLDFWYGLIKENIHRDNVQHLQLRGQLFVHSSHVTGKFQVTIM